jgi:hypothetical protein
LVPAEIYIAIVTAVITATVTLLAVFLTNRGNTNRLLLQLEHERNTKRAALHREKLEELYVLAVKYIKLLGSHCLPYVRVMEGKLDYNQALDLTIESGNKETPDFDRLQMLIDVYFPKLCESFKQILDVRRKMNEIMALHKAEYEQGCLDGRKFIKPMLATLDLLDKAGERFKNEIIAQEKAV